VVTFFYYIPVPVCLRRFEAAARKISVDEGEGNKERTEDNTYMSSIQIKCENNPKKTL
jgi:hypothetical protein